MARARLAVLGQLLPHHRLSLCGRVAWVGMSTSLSFLTAAWKVLSTSPLAVVLRCVRSLAMPGTRA